MIQNERASRHEHVLDVARQMMTAARTAPKGKGVDIIEIAMVTGDDLKVLSDKMVAMVEEHGMKFFLRDAANILQAECVIIIGTREQAQGLNCGHCGYPTCAGRPEGVPCAVNSVDVGIAIGSACATAADLRVDTRVIEGGKVILSFEAGTDDLMPVAQLKGFALAGTDGRYKWAEATVEGNKVVVWSEGIAQPTKVRYAWDDNPQEANLKNKAGLPASPFQMDVP